MKYSDVIPATFIRRPNRFVAIVDLDGVETTVHVKNTGRCRELLVPGNRVYLSVSDNPLRKTRHDLIAVEKLRSGNTPLMVNLDSQAPNEVAAEWLPRSGLFPQDACFHRETTWHHSRFDFYIENDTSRTFLEVKGVTLEDNGIASFPDAPTDRGVKHLHELIECQKENYHAAILFVIQMKEIRELRPNDATHAAFGAALRLAAAHGVKILAMDCRATPSTLEIDQPVKVVL